MSERRRKTQSGKPISPEASPPATPLAMPPGKLLRRSEAARLLGVSTSSVRRMEGTGLVPEIGPDGVHRFREEHVRELVVHRHAASPAPEAYDGGTAAEVFVLLDDGAHPVDIVKKLALDPRAVEALHGKWASMRGAFVVKGETAREIESLPWVMGSRPIRSGEELLSNLGMTDPKICAKCQNEEAHVCGKCARRMTEREAERREAQARERRDRGERERRRGEWEREFLPRLKASTR